MAKKVKSDEDSAPAFKFPEFDEKEYMRDEIRDAKAVIAATLLALPLAGAAALMTANVHPTAGIVVGIAGFGALYFLFLTLFKDLSVFKVKHWLMSIGGYFLTFLAVWILLINPPFMDLSAPVIEGPQYRTPTTSFAPVEDDLIQLPVGTTNWTIRVKVSDNVGVSGAPQISIAGGPPGPMAMVDEERKIYEAELDGTGVVVITARDAKGHEATYEISVY
jgi:hypothetical protein